MPFDKISTTSKSRVGLLLASLPELQALNRELRQLAELQSTLAEVLPDNLATFTSVALVKTGELILFANSSAVAAKLRQMAPRMLVALRARSHELTGIRVQVQVSVRDNPLPQKQIFLSLEARRAIDSLSERLSASPLKAALTRLGGHGR